MADTVITPSSTNDSGAAGWAIAIVVLAVILIGAFVWFQRAAPVPSGAGSMDVNVSLPEGVGGTGNTGGTGGTGGTQ